MKYQTLLFTAGLMAACVLAGCSSYTTYVKPDAPWATVKRVGVFPFATPFEDPVRRQWATQLFVTELERLKHFEVVELTGPPPSPGAPDFSALARSAGVDAFFRGTVEDMSEIFVDLKLVDSATGETLWSTRYHRGTGLEFSFRFHTTQQQLQRIYRVLLRRLLKSSR